MINQRIAQFIKDESGTQFIEYSLILAVVSLAAILSLKGVGTEVKDTFTNIKNAFPS